MKKVKPIEFILNTKTYINKEKAYDILFNENRKPKKEELDNVQYSFVVKIPCNDVDVFNSEINRKKILFVYKGDIIQIQAEMTSYHIGDGWVNLRGFPLQDKKEFDKLKSTLKIYSY